MRFLPVLLLFVAATAFTCRKPAMMDEQYATYSYKQTQCADPWQNSPTDSVTLANVAAYLASQNLHVANLQIKANAVAVICLACHCKTGKTIYVSSFGDEFTKAKLEALGFQP